jgi:transposase
MKQAIKVVQVVEDVKIVAVGIDVGDQWSHWCALSATGEVVGRGRVATRVDAVAAQASQWRGVSVALENGTHSGWMSRILAEAGCVVTVANPSRWRGTAHSSKNDTNDAESLARVVRVDPRLLYPIRHRSEQAQQDLAVVRARAQLVKMRTLLINTVRGLVKSLGHRLPGCDARYFADRTWERTPELLRPALAPLYASLRATGAQIVALEQVLEQLSTTRYPETELLRSVPGIGPITALTYVLTLGDKHRLNASREAGAYLGLRPKQRQSGDRDPQLGIAKNGDNYLRSLLVECAHHILSRGPDSALQRWGRSLTTGGKSAKRRALVAVARKLAVLLHRLWVTGQTFRPFPDGVPPMETVDAEVRAHRSHRLATTGIA